MNLNKTGIEWCDYTINPVKGKCPMACSYCYARKMYDRFKWNPEIRLEPLLDIHVKEGSRIFVGSTMELFGEWVKREWLEYIFKWVRAHPHYTFLFLTKQPQNLPQWSPFPDHCYVGVTVTKPEFLIPALDALDSIQCSVRYLSIEPMLGRFNIPDLDILLGGTLNQLIIGAQTRPTVYPKIEWVKEIVEAADKAGIAVFLKGNLWPILENDYGDEPQPFFDYKENAPIELRQELPDG